MKNKTRRPLAYTLATIIEKDATELFDVAAGAEPFKMKQISNLTGGSGQGADIVYDTNINWE